MTFTPSWIGQNGTVEKGNFSDGKVSKENNNPNNGDIKENCTPSNGHVHQIASSLSKGEERPVSGHGNVINNHSIYANTMMVPKMNGTPSTGKGHTYTPDSSTLAKISNCNTPTSKLAQSSLATNLDTSYNALLNTSKLSSSNSPSTNGTNTTGMDSSRENPNIDFELSTRISPPTAATGINVSLSRSSSHRQPQLQPDIQNRNYPSSPNISSCQHQQNPMNLTSYHHQNSTHKPFQNPKEKISQINSQHTILNTTKPQNIFNTSDILSPPTGMGERSFNLPHNSTLAPHANLCSSQNRSHNQSSNNSFFNTSFIPTRNVNGQRLANMTSGRGDAAGPMSGYGGKLKMLNSSLIPENVSKFMQKSKEVEVKDGITALGLLCLVSLLLALLSLIFLLKLSPVTEERRRELYRFNFLSAEQYVLVYELTLGLCALALSLNLCCLLVSSIQFFLAVKLVKSSPIHGRIRTKKYLQKAGVTRTCAIGGFLVSIPLFLTGIILYTFLHFDSTPAILTAIVIGIAIVVGGCAVVHNVLLWFKEDRNNRTHDSTSSTVDKRGEGDGEPALPMSPILKRVIDHNRRNNQEKYHQKSYVDLPHATLDLSGGDMFSPKNKANSSQAIDKQHTSLERAALELSTLV